MSPRMRVVRCHGVGEKSVVWQMPPEGCGVVKQITSRCCRGSCKQQNKLYRESASRTAGIRAIGMNIWRDSCIFLCRNMLLRGWVVALGVWSHADRNWRWHGLQVVMGGAGNVQAGRAARGLHAVCPCMLVLAR